MRAIILAILVASSPAAAEPKRSGFMVGASLGAGGASACDGCERLAGGAAEIHIGGWLTPQFALSYEAWVFTGDPSRMIYNGSGAGMAVATMRVAPRVWVKGGAGMAMYTHEDPIGEGLTGNDMSIEHRGVGLGAGVGYELYQSRGSFVIDVSARSVLGMFPGHGASVSGSALIGLSWN